MAARLAYRQRSEKTASDERPRTVLSIMRTQLHTITSGVNLAYRRVSGHTANPERRLVMTRFKTLLVVLGSIAAAALSASQGWGP